MRILHTADWHLNDRLGWVKRQGDITARLREIASYLEEYKVDVMVVAGDVFSEYKRIDEVRDALGDVVEIFRPFLVRGGNIVAISGNHDNPDLFNLLRHALDIAAPVDMGRPGLVPRGRFHLAAQPRYLLLEDEHGQAVQFVLLPYPTPKVYLYDEDARYASTDEKNRRLHAAMIKKLNEIRDLHVDKRLPSVLVSHAHIRGSNAHSLYRITEREDVMFEQGDIPTNWAYAAYGHIHKPQAMSGTSHVRYSGSIERFDYAERDDEKSVVLFDVTSDGRTEDPVCLPLHATPVYRVEILDPSVDMPGLRDRFPDADSALVSLKLTYRPGEHNRDELCRELDDIFPRCYSREIISEGSLVNLGGASIAAPRDVEGTVMAYLHEQLKADPDRDDLIALARTILATEGVTC